jgi:peptide/nickel transport system substrate-binding protein
MAGGAAAAAAFLAACGGGDDTETGGDASSRDTSGLLSKIVDSSKQAKSGGRYVYPARREPLHFDGKAQGQVQLNVFNGLAYEALVRNKPGIGEPSTWSEVEPQLAESWEVSGDKLTLTFKLRQGVKWHNRPPINGRAFEAEDVVVTWRNYENASTPNNKAANSNKVNPAAPIVSMEAPDARTVVVKLKAPASYIMQRFASMITGELGSIYPKEAGTTFDAKKDQIGTGAWMLDKFTPSVGLTYARNPEYWDKSSGHFDVVDMPVIPEYTTRLAQFKTGALSSELVSPEDIVTTKREVPDVAMYSWTAATNSTGASYRFNWGEIGGKPSPFKDERLRQALSMAQDRDTYIDAFSNVSRFQSDGLPVDTYYFTAMGYVPDWTLDPRNANSFGSAAKYYPSQANMEEAKKLFNAAQSAYGGNFPKFVTGRVNVVFGPIYAQETDVLDNYGRELGFEIDAYPLDYNLDYLPKVVTQQGYFKVPDMGWAYAIGAVTSPDPLDYYIWRFYSKSGATSGSLGDGAHDREVDAMIEEATAEFDVKKRMNIVHDLQRYLGEKQYTVTRPGFADNFLLAWPAIENFATFQGDSRVVGAGALGLHDAWFNTSKAHG